MTNQEIIIAVAESLGWKMNDHPDTQESIKGWTHPTPWVLKPDNTQAMIHDIPDYPNDLNACVVFERALDHSEYCRYRSTLYCLVRPIEDANEFNNNRLCYQQDRDYLSATAHQRCEAYLKCRGLWKDVK